MRVKIIIVLLVFIVLVVGSIILVKGIATGNKVTTDDLNNSQNNETVSDANIFYKINSDTYRYTLQENDVVIKYPVLNSNEIDLRYVNELIKEKAISVFNTDEEYEQYIDIDYEIAFYNNEFISIIFKGLANTNLSAHPTNIFYTLNIDIEKGSIIKLTDIYKIDRNFIEIYISELKKQNLDVVEYLESYTDENLEEMFHNADMENDGIFSYFTESSIGISLPTIYALGDHFEMEINEELLKNNLR